MKINQLFKLPVPEDLLHNVMECFGFKHGCDEHMFCKYDLDRMQTVEKMRLLKDELFKYYLPCKARLYLNDLDGSTCITILRQILRLHGMALISHQKYVKQSKCTMYSIQERETKDSIITNIKIDMAPTVINFQ